MLPKSRKVPTPLLKIIMAKGLRVQGTSLYLRMVAINPEKDSVFGVIVSKKVAKRAVDRNLLKRRVFHSLRNSIKDCKKGFASLIFLKEGIEKASFKDIEEETRALLKKAAMIQ